MSKIIIPKEYESKLTLIETNEAIKFVKDTFQTGLADVLNLTRVSAPLFVEVETGFNDNLNGIERAVSFRPQNVDCSEVQVIHSLAKWKRYALDKYGFEKGKGLYTDMNAIRQDEELDNIHSLYVDQWDWEQVIDESDRTLSKLKSTVRKIYQTILKVEQAVLIKYPQLVNSKLPNEITFITAEELVQKYPNLTAKERENKITKKYGAVFIIGIGDLLSNGERHDGRAPDYDDWTLNGDIIVWNETLQCAFELSSMGIRVSEESLMEQLEKSKQMQLISKPFHQKIMNKELPYTIGGGIGQSRLCMYFLRKAHIGEVQASLWDEKTYQICNENKIQLL